MDKISLMLDNLETTMLRIGRVGENLHTQVRVNCISIFHDYPNATTSLTVQPPNGEAYPAIIDREGVVIVWDVLDSDLTEVGNGQVQFTFTDDDEIIKTVIGSTQILPSIEPTGEAPTPIENWIDEANELLNEFGEIDQMTASAETVAAGVPADVEVSKVDGHLHLDFSIPRGQSGNETIDDTAGIGDTDKVWSADKDAKMFEGVQEDLTAGNALYLLSDRGDTDIAPYVFRKTGGAKNGYGREFLRKIVGGTVAWNQLARELSSSYYLSEGVASISFSNGIAKFTASRLYGQIRSHYDYRINTQIGHKYLISARIKLTSATNKVLTQLRYADESANMISKETISQTAEQVVSAIGSASGTKVAHLRIIDTRSSGWDEIQVRNLVCFDLTAMFGSTIADAIYAMEQATAGSGVAWFRSLFPNDYYAYDAGSLQSVQAKEHRLTGFNQWDEQWELGSINVADGTNADGNNNIRSKNYIPCIPNAEYYFNRANIAGNIFQYDKNKNFIKVDSSPTTFTTEANCCYLRFYMGSAYGTTYKNDLCVNLSDSSRNGQYKPYESHTYPLDSSLTLRGIPKWDSTNGLYYDGDEYTPDGSVKRKYGIVDLGTLSWNYEEGGLNYPRHWARLTGSKGTGCYAVCERFIYSASPIAGTGDDRTMYVYGSPNPILYIYDFEYTDAAAFKSAMSGVYLVYELATPTTEQAEPYRELQISANGGTEEFIDAGVTASTPTRDVSVPVGTETFYPVDIWHLIDELTALVLEN